MSLAGACRGLGAAPPLPRSAPADGAAAPRGRRGKGRLRFRPRRKEQGWGVGGGMAHAFSRPAARLSCPRPRPAPTWLNQARLCSVNPEHLDPGAPLPRLPARPRPPCGEGPGLRFASARNPATSPPHAGPAPRETPRLPGGRPRPRDPAAALGFQPTHVSPGAPSADAFHNQRPAFISNKTFLRHFLVINLVSSTSQLADEKTEAQGGQGCRSR